MQPRPATLDGIDGSGYAIVKFERNGRKSCVGVFTSPSVGAGLSMAARQSGTSIFSGVVYNGGEAHHLTFEVIVTNINAGNGGTRADFTATGNPYAASQQGTKDELNENE